MCGIAGVFHSQGLRQDQAGIIQEMNLMQKHRGPDDEGLFEDSRCVLGHRRLAVIDLSRDGRQPFVSDDDRYHLVYNGEIYNYIELRRTLEGRGHHFKTRTDTEVLLKAYQEYGSACLTMLNGMFAFGVYDRHAGSLFLARDRFGIKPLYYCVNDSAVYFASEVRALCRIPGLQPQDNPQALFDYLVFNRTDVFDETFHRNILRLPKGHCATVDASGLRLKRWWNAEDFLASGPEHADGAVEKVHDLFVQSVDLRMRSDVAVGACLSGGLDSSIIVGNLLSRDKAPDSFAAFTASFPGHAVDEMSYVEEVKRRFSFSHHMTYPTGEGAFAGVEDFVQAAGEPVAFPSFYAQYEVMRLAREKGVTVLLDGQGGDEVFAGYQYFHGFYLYELLRNVRPVRFLSEMGSDIMRHQHPSAYQTLLFQCLPRGIKKALLRRQVPYMSGSFFEQHLKTSRIWNEFFDAPDLNTSLVRHFQYKLEHLLRIEDHLSMAFSLEARVPYLDHRLVEYALGLASELKISKGQTKALQKEALGRYSVPAILDRRDKVGFEAPCEAWMRQPEWQRLAEESFAANQKHFPQIFDERASLPENPFVRWKMTQQALWKKQTSQGSSESKASGVKTAP